MTVKFVGGNVIVTDRQMRQRDPNDYYRTDTTTIRGYFHQYPLIAPHTAPMTYLDPGAGDGVWGTTLRTHVYPDLAYVAGVELQEQFSLEPVSAYDTWTTCDFLSLDTPWDYPGLDNGFDLIAGNPPYKHAEAFFHKARLFAAPTSTIIFLLRLGFLASERRYTSMWMNGFTPTMTTVCNTRPSFTGDGKTYPGDFAFLRWSFIDGECMDMGLLNFLVYDRE